MKKYLLILILGLSALIRLLTLSRLMVFTPDEEYIIYIAQTLVHNFHIIWIGVSALGLDFYMGPFWIYFIYPFVGLAHGDPLILGVITSLFGVVTTFLIYLVGKKIFNFRVGVIASIFYGFSALTAYYDQQPYPPAVPFLSLFMLLCLYMSQKSKKWWIMFSIAYGLVFHIHLSLFLIIFVAIYWAFLQRKKINRKIVILSFLAFVVTISPLIAFDYFHKASNVTVVFRIFQNFGKNRKNLDLPVRVNNLTQAMGRVFYLVPKRNNADEILYPCMIRPNSTTTHVSFIVFGLPLLLFLYFFKKGDFWKDKDKRLILLFSLCFLVPFLFMSIFNPIEYYLLGFIPVMFLMIAYSIDNLTLKIKFFLYFLIFLFALHGAYTVLGASGDFGIDDRKILINHVMSFVGDKPFTLSESGNCYDASGFRYLFLVYGRAPERSSEDKVFSWLWPNEVSKKPAKFSVLITETRAGKEIPKGYIDSFSVHGFTSYIYLASSK